MKVTKKTIIPETLSLVICECGQQIRFKYNKPCICKECGRKVYPSKEMEFKEKMKREMIKHE